MRKFSRSKIGAKMVAVMVAAVGISSPVIANDDGGENETAIAATQMESEAPEEVSSQDDGRRDFLPSSGRLLLTGGVSTIEGAGGGGLVPWALIGGYGTRDELGFNAYATGVDTRNFTLASYGASVNFANRVELSVARQNFNLREVGNVLALGNRYTISQTILGAKVRLFGDAVLEQDSLLPQVAAGVQYKINDDETVVGGRLALSVRASISISRQPS